MVLLRLLDCVDFSHTPYLRIYSSGKRSFISFDKHLQNSPSPAVFRFSNFFWKVKVLMDKIFAWISVLGKYST